MKSTSEQRLAEMSPPEIKAAVTLNEKIATQAVGYLDEAKTTAMSVERACELRAWRRNAMDIYKKAGKSEHEAHIEFIDQATKAIDPPARPAFNLMIKEAVQTCMDAKPAS